MRGFLFLGCPTGCRCTHLRLGGTAGHTGPHVRGQYPHGEHCADRWDDIKGAFAIPISLIRHPNYTRPSPWVHKLIADLTVQYTGYNNGYLRAAWTLMRPRGWRSRTTLEMHARS